MDNQFNDFVGKIVLNSVSGSQLYGTDTPESDRDYRGIFIPTSDYMFGLLKMPEESEFGSIVDKDSSNKNTKYSVDAKYFEIRKFINLAAKCNPNLIEMVFVNDASIIECSEEFDVIRVMYDKFLSRESIYKRFGEYAKSQRYKMVVKLEHYNLYKEFESEYNSLVTKDSNYKNELISILVERKLISNLSIEKDCIKFADTHFTKSHTLYKCYKQVKERLDKISNREELVLKYGYDTKFASHYIRLLLEGIELLNTGKLEFPLEYAYIIKGIKLGQKSLDDVLFFGESLENNLRAAYEKSKVREYSDFEFLNNMTIKMLKNYYLKSY